MEANHTPGQKVICVRGGGHPGWPEAIPLVQGRVYTIRDTTVDPRNGRAYVHLQEVVNQSGDCVQGFGEPYYRSDRFVPIIKRETDISIFKKTLVPQRKPALADS